VRTSRATKAKKLSAVVKDNLFALADLVARGDSAAAAELYSSAALATHWLNFLVDQAPDTVTPIAEKKLSWPVMYGLHHELRQEVYDFVKDLKVGAKSGINVSGVGKSFSWEKPANEIAFQLYRLAELVRHTSVTSIKRSDVGKVDLSPLAALRVGWPSPKVHRYDDKYAEQLRALEFWGQNGGGSRLPPLSRSTASQWAEQTSKLFRILFGREFDAHHRLEGLKKSVLESVKGREPSIVRSRMLKAVKQAWRSIAPLE